MEWTKFSRAFTILGYTCMTLLHELLNYTLKDCVYDIVSDRVQDPI